MLRQSINTRQSEALSKYMTYKGLNSRRSNEYLMALRNVRRK